MQETDWMPLEHVPSFIASQDKEVSNYIVRGKINPKAGASLFNAGRYFGHFFNIANIEGVWMVLDAQLNYTGKDFFRWPGNTVEQEKVYKEFKLYYRRDKGHELRNQVDLRISTTAVQ